MIRSLFKLAQYMADPENLIYKGVQDKDFRKMILNIYSDKMENIRKLDPGISILDYKELPGKVKEWLERKGVTGSQSGARAIDVGKIFDELKMKRTRPGSRLYSIYLPESGIYLTNEYKLKGVPETLFDKIITPYHELSEIEQLAKYPGSMTYFLAKEPINDVYLMGRHANIDVLRDEFGAINRLEGPYMDAYKKYRGLREPLIGGVKEKFLIPYIRKHQTREYNLLDKDVPIPGKNRAAFLDVDWKAKPVVRRAGKSLNIKNVIGKFFKK